MQFIKKPVKTVDSIISSISQNIIDLELAEAKAAADRVKFQEEAAAANVLAAEAMKEEDRALRIKSRLIDLIS